MSNNIAERVKTIIAQQAFAADLADVPPGSLTADTSLKDLPGFDSLDVVEITMALEDEFDMEIPDDVMHKFTTVGSVIDYVEVNTK